MIFARSRELFSLCAIVGWPRRPGDWTLVGVTGFLLGAEVFGVLGTATLGRLCGVPRLVGYLSSVEGALDEGGEIVELDPVLC